MKAVIVIDRKTRKSFIEHIYGGSWLKFLYTKNPLAPLLRLFIAKNPLFSKFYGWRQTRPSSQKKVIPFIKKFSVDMSEYAEPAESFKSFNEFFVRKLKKNVRTFPANQNTAILPADGRHHVIEDLTASTQFYVKGQKFDLGSFLQDEELATKFEGGSMLISRLCPVDYHRFHFPITCTPQEPQPIDGALYSVSPLALGKRLAYLWENKRVINKLESDTYGTVLFVEIGATCVGTIHHTSEPGTRQERGAEKGFFSFGGSMVITLFQKNKIRFDKDLIDNSKAGHETLAKMGDTLGTPYP